MVDALPGLERMLVLSLAIISLAWTWRRLPTELLGFSALVDDGVRARMLTAVEANVSAVELQRIFDGVPSAARADLANSVHVSDSAQKTALFLACANRAPGLVRLTCVASPAVPSH